MAFVPCEWFYEHMLGDNCDNKCNECFGDKDVRICKEDFEVVGEMLNTITIKKGSWWSVVFMNHDHVLLDGLDGYQLSLKRDNKLDMTIREQLEQIKAEICDSYCKYTNVIELEPDELEKECEYCPFTKL